MSFFLFLAKIWPAPKNFVPYDVFDEVYNPITNLPPLEGEEPAKEDIDSASLSINTAPHELN